MEKQCIKCGVTICDKNIYTTIADPNYKCKTCRHCRSNAKKCEVFYQDVSHQILSKKNNQKICDVIQDYRKRQVKINTRLESSTTCQTCRLPKIKSKLKGLSICSCHKNEIKKLFSLYQYKDPALEELSKKNCDYLTRKLRQHQAWLLRKVCPIYIKKRKINYTNWRSIPGNIERVRLASQRKNERHVGMMNDAYIKSLINYDNTLSVNDITPELIELKRKQLTLYRYVQEQKKDINCQ